MTELSAVIITKNAAKDIQRCLNSVRWANEIIIVDSGSEDETVTLARKYTDKIFVTDWPGFGPQKNRAIAHATCPWILSIDADEWLSDALQQEIIQRIKEENTNHTIDAYWITRQSFFIGKLMKYGSCKNDRIVRLFKNGRAKFTDDLVHERLIVNGQIGTLKKILMHEPFKNYEDVINKMNHYSSYGAANKIRTGKKASLPQAIGHGLWTFICCYFLQLGFLDGKAGFVMAISNAEGSYYRYLKMALLQN